MKVAIHGENNHFFSGRWIAYCKRNKIPYQIVNAYDSDIVFKLKDFDLFLWQHTQAVHKDLFMAKQLLYSLEVSGLKIFPNFNTTWHFDDKIGQKYLLESIEAPLIPSYVFYSKSEALAWANETEFPKVFKLRGGAGSMNVWLVKNQKKALSFINKAFGHGFCSYNWKHRFNDELMKLREGNANLSNILKLIVILFRKYPNEYSRILGKEKGYVYFQEFVPGNTYDIRVIVIGGKAFAIKRINRKGDFRASGSGKIIYNKKEIDLRCIEISFEVNKKIQSQCIAYDFVIDPTGRPLIVEISFGFKPGSYDKCEGYWDIDLNWYDENVDPCGWIIDALLSREDSNINLR